MLKVKKIKGYIISHYCYFKDIYKLKTSKKIIIGSSGTFHDLWFSTDYPQIDIKSIEQCKKYWETKWGKVLRSRDFDSRNSSQKAPSYSSIIIDCFKT